jgi:hypothetical protein
MELAEYVTIAVLFVVLVVVVATLVARHRMRVKIAQAARENLERVDIDRAIATQYGVNSPVLSAFRRAKLNAPSGYVSANNAASDRLMDDHVPTSGVVVNALAADAAALFADSGLEPTSGALSSSSAAPPVEPPAQFTSPDEQPPPPTQLAPSAA